MNETGNITDLRHNMEQAAKIPESGVKGTYVEPLVSAAKEQPSETQRGWVEKSAGLSMEGKDRYKFNPNPAAKNISKTEINKLMHPYNKEVEENYAKSIGYFKASPPATDAMERGTAIHERIEQMASNLPNSNCVPEPTVRKVTEFPLFGGVRIVPYTTANTDSNTRHMSHALNLFNDFAPESMEQYASIKMQAKDLGAEEHLTPEGVPNPYGLSGKYDMMMVGRPNTSFAGKKVLVDFKTTRMDANRPFESIMQKANQQITEEAFYKFLFEKAGKGADEYGVFYTDTGQLALFSKEMLQQRMDRDVMKFVQQIHKDQSPFRNLMAILRDEVKV